MDKTERARVIIDHVLNLNTHFNRAGPPRSDKALDPCRLISDDPRWKARHSPAYDRSASEGPWDLFELFVYGEARMTAAFRGEEIDLRFYRPGNWEHIFLIVDPRDTVPLLP